MATQRKPAARTPAKPKTTVESVITEAEKAVEHDYEEVKTVVTEETAKLEGLTVMDLRRLHDEALVAESEAKRLVHILRQHANNAAVDIDISAEEAVIAAKKDLAKAIDWVKTIEQKLENEFRDIWGKGY